MIVITKDITELVNLSSWKTKKEIIQELRKSNIKIDERQWRLIVEEYNQQYMEVKHPYYIVHSRKGYMLTDDKEEIKKSIKDLRSRSLNMLKKYSLTMRAIGLQDNLRIDLEEMEII